MEKTEKIKMKETFEDRLKVFDEFKIAKSKILSPEDFAEVVIRDKKTKELRRRKIILKSGWRKIKLFFGISSEIIEVRREKDGDKIIYICKARVYTQSGITSEAVGICSSDEPGKSSMNEYILSSIAQTRAINKAIADLVGVDFEEDEFADYETRECETEEIGKQKLDEKKKIESSKPVAADKNLIVSQIFEMIKEISESIPRYEIFSKIKKHFGLDEKQQFKITDLDTKQLTELVDFLNSMRKEKTEEVIF